MLDRLRAATARLDEPRLRRVAVTAIILVLLVATAGAFALAERLKLERSPVAAPRVTRLIGPVCECERGRGLMQLTLRKADRIDVSIVDGADEPVRSLATDLRRSPGVVAFTWDGRGDDGEVVPDGRYRLRVHLDRDGRTVTVPTPIRVDSTAPRIRLVSATPKVVSPDDDGRGERVLYVYRSTERSYPVVYVDDRYTVRGAWRPAGRGRVRWRGRFDGDPAPMGLYATSLVAVDVAGNQSEPTPVVPVRVRYLRIVLARRRVPLDGTLSFRLDADAKTVDWSLTRIRTGARFSDGTAPPGRVAVPLRGALPGPYVLEATVNGRSDQAIVRVARR